MNDNGVYVLVSPTIGKSMEYRVAHLTGNENIQYPTLKEPEILNPELVCKFFNQSKTFSDEFDAKEEAYRLADNMYMTNPPIFTVYLNTPYSEWSTDDDKEIQEK